MNTILKVLVGIFAVVGILVIVALVVLFFDGNSDSSVNKECEEKVAIDKTSIPLENGIEEYNKFRKVYFTNYSFQRSRTKFPINGIPGNMWSVDKWTPCNWQTLTPYYMDTITYGFRKAKFFEDTPYEHREEIFRKSDSLASHLNTTLKFKLEASKWFLTERIY